MDLQAKQIDTLLHLSQSAFSQASDIISRLAGNGLTITASHLELRRTRELSTVLSGVFRSKIIKVAQRSTGAVAGEVVLFLDHDPVLMMCSQLSDRKIQTDRLDRSDQELVLEVGNMMILTFLSALTTLVQEPLHLDGPSLSINTLETFLPSLTDGGSERQQTLMVPAQMSLASESAASYLFFPLPSSLADSIARVMHTSEPTDSGVP